MKKASFEKEFLPGEKELLVLVQTDVGGAAVIDDYLRLSATFLASVDVETGEFCDKKGRLEWMMKREPNGRGWGFDLKGMTIYRVRVRKGIEKELEPHMLKEMNNRYLLLEILEQDVRHEELEKIREAYTKPVEMDNEIGHFALDRDYDWYEGEIDWLGENCQVMLELDAEGADTADKAMDALRRLVEDLASWDERIRRFAAKELVELANDWREEEDEEVADITPEEFAKRIEISEISVDADGDMEITFNDDDMFWGHYIVVYANISGGLERAQIEG